MIRSALALLAVSIALTAAGGGAGFTPEAGTHYRAVDPPVATEADPGQVEVIEFFSLGCAACAAFEPHLRSWLQRKPPAIAFRRVPATFNAPFKLLAKVQLALTDVGAAERLIPVLFDAIHTRRDPALTRPLATWQGMLPKGNAAAIADAERDVLAAFGAFVAARGVDRARFDAALRSPSVALRLAQSESLFKRYGGTGIPAIAVGGRWFTHTARPFSFESYDQLLGTVDHLARKAAR